MNPDLFFPWEIAPVVLAASQTPQVTTFVTLWSWVILLGLGAFHGINPGMGWLFAVALGMQHKTSRAIWWALLPLTLGHGLAIGGIIGVASLAGVILPYHWIQLPVAMFLVAMGLYRIFHHCRFRWAAMRVGMVRLTIWSFLMASAHGAGLMVLPIFLGMTASAHNFHRHAGILETSSGPVNGLLVTLVHGAGYLVTTGLVAWIVYEKLGLRLLRKAWFNLDLIWAGALMGTGLLAFAL
jgi:hypothetical protein